MKEVEITLLPMNLDVENFIQLMLGKSRLGKKLRYLILRSEICMTCQNGVIPNQDFNFDVDNMLCYNNLNLLVLLTIFYSINLTEYLMRVILALLAITIHVLIVYADGPCFPKQALLSLGDSYYSDSIGNEGNIRTNQRSDTSRGNDVAKIVWVTLDSCNDSSVTIQKTNSSDQSQKYKPKTEYYSQYINETYNTVHTEGQYTRYSQIVELTDIEPDTLYTALLNSSDGSTSFNFKIPHPDSPEKPLKILFYADIDYSNVSLPTISRLQSYFSKDNCDINLTFFGGDLAYEIVDEAGLKGDQFFEYFQPFWTTRPMLMTPGNHDYYYNYSMLNYRMKMPLYNLSQNHYYSWNVGSAHFLTINYDFYDDADNDTQARMYQWVERDLTIANSTENRLKRPWIIIITHRPIYCSQSFIGAREPSSCHHLYGKRKNWDDLMGNFKVDFYIAAHMHNYERMKALAYNQSWPYEKTIDSDGVEVINNPSAPIHVIDGSSGDDYFMITEPYPRGEFSEIVDVNVGLSILTIYNSSVIGWKHFKSDDESVIDQFYIKRDRPPTPTAHFDPIITGMFLLLVAAVIYTYFRKKPSSVPNSNLGQPLRTVQGEQEGILLRELPRDR